MVRSPDGTINIKIVLKPQIVIGGARPAVELPPPAPQLPAPAVELPPPVPQLPAPVELPPPAPAGGQTEEAAVGAALAEIARALGTPPSASAPPSAPAPSAGPCAAIANVLYTVPTADHNELAILREACAAAGLDCSVLNNCSNDAVVGVLGTLLTTVTEQTPNCRDILRDTLSTLACAAPAPSVAPAPAPAPSVAPPAAPALSLPAPAVAPSPSAAAVAAAAAAEVVIEAADIPLAPPVAVEALKQLEAKKKDVSPIKKIVNDQLFAAKGLVRDACRGSTLSEAEKQKLADDAVDNIWTTLIEMKRANPTLKLRDIPPDEWGRLLDGMEKFITTKCTAAGGRLAGGRLGALP